MTRFAASADGIPIAFEVAGRGGPALVFVHGWCCDRRHWDAQLAHFRGTSVVVALDLAGHGRVAAGWPAPAPEANGPDA